ncbi:MAG: hypothetical protein GY928_11215 [Colwellia sp.]|nr:hypothetical protein [Colwellia sp.]
MDSTFYNGVDIGSRDGDIGVDIGVEAQDIVVECWETRNGVVQDND